MISIMLLTARRSQFRMSLAILIQLKGFLLGIVRPNLVMAGENQVGDAGVTDSPKLHWHGLCKDTLDDVQV